MNKIEKMTIFFELRPKKHIKNLHRLDDKIQSQLGPLNLKMSANGFVFFGSTDKLTFQNCFETELEYIVVSHRNIMERTAKDWGYRIKKEPQIPVQLKDCIEEISIEQIQIGSLIYKRGAGFLFQDTR